MEKTIFISKIQGFYTGIFIHCHSTGTVLNMHALECLKLVGAGTPLQKNPEFCWGLVRFLARSLRSLAALWLVHSLRSLPRYRSAHALASLARSHVCPKEGARFKGSPSPFFSFPSFLSFFPSSFSLFFLPVIT